jgi:hypothetical protein
MTTVDRAKILSKILKCLALSKSCNEHEAAAALRQAQKLMVAHDVSERELGLLSYTSSTVTTNHAVAAVIPVTLSSIIHLIRGAFGVRSLCLREKYFVVKYYGPESRVMLAAYAHDVVNKAIKSAWAKELETNPQYKGHRGAKAGFYSAWCAAVRQQVADFAMGDDEVERTVERLAQDYPNTRKSKVNNQRVLISAMSSGAKAAEGFSLHRPIG